MTENKKLVYRFCELPQVIRWEIALDMNLVEQGQQFATDVEFNNEVFKSAARQGKVEALRRKVTHEHGKLFPNRE